MAVFRIAIWPRESTPSTDGDLVTQLTEAGLTTLKGVQEGRLFFLDGQLSAADAGRIADSLLADPVTESVAVCASEGDLPAPAAGELTVEVHPRPGVMDPVADSTLSELRAEEYAVDAVRTARVYRLVGKLAKSRVGDTVGRVLANDCIEEVFVGTAGIRPAPRPPQFEFKLRHVAIRELDGPGLDKLSRDAHLFLSRDEMETIRDHFRELGRDPTDLELETLAQTWSEHCVHKTLKSAVTYRGAPLPPVELEGRHTPPGPADHQPIERHYDNLLKDTIARATEELIAAGRGPECLSVFKDNAGVIGFDDEFGVAFKVETHNHPSAIEPYGGAATGIGGCIRDVMGCGLGAKPIANTDVFCVAPPDWPADRLPKGVLHPRRVLRGIVQGVADYGNRMGIPTVNGAVYFDPRYLGNPLVYCGCVGLMPRDKVHKAARPGDRVVVIGGRTGRDGIHGATFSSAELTDTHADEFSHAVQIGNAITEKRCLDAMLRARDHADGCLYTATTDCGAGGLSSAVGEMGERVGVAVELQDVPLKYAGLRYDEIWISEAQERMVLAVPPDRLDRLMAIMAEEEVEATVIGTFGHSDPDTGRPQLVVRYAGAVVGTLDMAFLHDGLPRRTRAAHWQPAAPVAPPAPAAPAPPADVLAALQRRLAGGNVTGKQWIIRRYDHEVQGGSVVKSLCGPGAGPSDAAVLRPRLGAPGGIAVGCGMVPTLSDVDPYWMAAASIDEALRNVIAVGGDPTHTAILDNFCWGRSDDAEQLGGLVRACQACYDAATVYGVPFISGKDSLNNEYALEAGDIESLAAVLTEYAARGDDAHGLTPAALPAVLAQVRRTGRLRIPATLLISAISLIDDVTRCCTPDLKQPGAELWLVGGLPQVGFRLTAAYDVHTAVAQALRAGHVAVCHDVSDGGWLVAAAEMALAGNRGAELAGGAVGVGPFAPLVAGYVVETRHAAGLRGLCVRRGVTLTRLGVVRDDAKLVVDGAAVPVEQLRAAWALAR